jgi:hypothetical protein
MNPAAILMALALSAGGQAVQTTGKVEVPLAEVPAEVLAVARAAQPGFVPAEAEAETREGRRYFDVEGRLPDGAEIEFDIMEENGVWRVVETQRDIAFSAAPAQVQAAARGHDPAIAPTRVIESVQANGLVIYEVYQGERKLEVKWDGRSAELLTREWAH